MERYQIYLTKEQRDFIEWFGNRFDIIANTGRTAGRPDKSAVIRLAIDSLMENTRDDLNEVGRLPWHSTGEPMPGNGNPT
jgi:hypothetical protein